LIYTTYFAKIKSLPDNVIPIAICGKAPVGYKGLQYKKLAPRYDFFMEWKRTGDNNYYIKCFKDQVLDRLNADDIVFELSDAVYNIYGTDMDIALVCYEKSEDFCHRHLVAEWLREHGYRCEEFK
jgi:uncharacterized protein (DUF488 family)